jgi:hypothetical protein
MSILKKNTLALAILAAAGFAVTANAYVVTTGGTTVAAPTIPGDIAPEDIAIEAASPAVMTQAINIGVQLGDSVIGRTTGLQVRITLLDGASFGAALTSASLGAPADQTALVDNLGANGGWTTNLAAGGALNGTVAQFALNPSGAGSSIRDGVLGRIAGLSVNKPAGAAVNSVVRLRVELVDPVSGNVLVGADGSVSDAFREEREIIRYVPGLTFACIPEANADKIDVAGDRADGNPAPGAAFVASPFTIGGPFIGGNNLVAADNDSSRGTVALRSLYALNTAAAGDRVVIRLTGSNLTNLSFFAVPAAQTCLTGTSVGSFVNVAPVAPATIVTQTVFDREINAINVAAPATIVAGPVVSPAFNGTLRICANGAGGPVEAQGFTATVSINGTNAVACSVAAIEKNGSTVNIANLPPAGNPTQEGLVRIVNNSTLSGRVTIRAKDDTGTNGTAPVTFTLPAGRSVVYTTAELESGTAATVTPAKPALSGSFGDGAGRWRVNIVGEFDNMQAQAYVRNVNNDALSNITDFESNQEQTDERKNLNFD